MVVQARKMQQGFDDVGIPDDPDRAMTGGPDASGTRTTDAGILELAERIGQLRAAFVDIEKQLSGMAAQIATMTESGPLAAARLPATAPPLRQPEPVGPSAQDMAPQSTTPMRLTPPDAPQVDLSSLRPELFRGRDTPVACAEALAASSDLEPAVAVPDRLDRLLETYRLLLDRPRKADINNWIEDEVGQNVEIAEGNALQLVGRDAGGLLVLVQTGERSAIIVPGSRLVVEFATGFADVISMRSVTRHAFDLTSGGTGKLQLLQPALAEQREGHWMLSQPGKLAGFTS